MRESIRLSQTVKKGGCAAKVAALELRQILREVIFPPPPDQLLVRGETFDDAGVFQISADLALVQTLDFFTPIVDTPRLFGQIAACNALSDVYAMGGDPQTALGILAFPLATMPREVASDILQGAVEVLKEAKCSLLGGHTIDDETLKFGLSVTGYVHPKKIWRNSTAQSGDRLLLTKPLGTGTLMAGIKQSMFSEEDVADALQSMAQLNQVKDLLTQDLLEEINAATDVTGFGLAGHAYNMALASDKTFVFDSSLIPHFSKAKESLDQGLLTKAHRTNREYTEGAVKGALPLIALDPQTSGGLLLSVKPDHVKSIVDKLRSRFHHVREIGWVEFKKDYLLEFV